jgi:hypothetical protein
MAKATWIKVSGTWKQVKNVWEKVGGVWKQKVIPKGSVSGSWKEYISYYLEFFVQDYDNVYRIAPDTYARVSVNSLSNLSAFAINIDGDTLIASGNSSAIGFIKKISPSGVELISKVPTIVAYRMFGLLDGSVIIHGESTFSGLAKLTTTLDQVWKISNPAGYFNDMIVNINGISFLADDYGLYRVTTAGVSTKIINSVDVTSLATDKYGNVYYMVADKLYKITSDGTAVTNVDVGTAASYPVIRCYGEYIYCFNGYVFTKYNLSLGLISSVTKTYFVSTGNVVINEAGIFTLKSTGELHCLDFNFNEIYSATIAKTTTPYIHPEKAFLRNLG